MNVSVTASGDASGGGEVLRKDRGEKKKSCTRESGVLKVNDVATVAKISPPSRRQVDSEEEQECGSRSAHTLSE